MVVIMVQDTQLFLFTKEENEMINERERRTAKAYKDGKIKQDTFGQLAMSNFSDEIFEKAVEREWITKELAYYLMNGKKEGNKMTVKEMRAEAKEMGIKGYSRMSKEELQKNLEEAKATEVKTVEVRAFTGMVLGKFEVVKETEKLLIVKTKKGVAMKFDKATGIQTNGNNPKFANRI